MSLEHSMSNKAIEMYILLYMVV